MAFPTAPTNGQTYTDPLGRRWGYTLASDKWNLDTSADKAGNNYTATAAPTAANDNTQGYKKGSHWVDTAANLAYFCIDASTGAAQWVDVVTAVQWTPLAADPVSPVLGDTWYRTDLNTFKGTVEFQALSWVTQALPPISYAYSGGLGNSASYLLSGGSITNLAYLYTSPTWAATGSLPVTLRGHGSAGVTNAGLLFNGSKINVAPVTPEVGTYLFNGSVFSTSTNAITARRTGGGVGTDISAKAVAGVLNSAGTSTELVTDRLAGTTWATDNSILSGSYSQSVSGSVGAVMLAGGYIGGAAQNRTEIDNGIAWVASTNIPIAGVYTGFGTITNTVIVGTVGAFLFDGITYSTTTNLNTPVDFTDSDSTIGGIYDGMVAGGGASETLSVTTTPVAKTFSVL